jgi:hypothetical protein
MHISVSSRGWTHRQGKCKRLFMRKFESSTLLYSNDVMYASDDATTYYDCGIKYNHPMPSDYKA